MSLMMSKLYHALLSAGASEERAREAAEESAGTSKDMIEVKTTLKIHTGLILAILLLVIGLYLK